MGKVIFNADDFGYGRAVNYGIVDAHTEGILTSTTLMANMPGFHHAVRLAGDVPDLGIGVHLTLTMGKPLLSTVDTLISPDGNFRKQGEYLGGYEADLDQLFDEWDAQIQKVYDAGIAPTHLDSHHHAHSFGKHPEVAIALAKKYDLPLRTNISMPDDIRHTQYFEPMFDQVGFAPEERQISDMDGYLNALLETLRTYDSTEIMCHPAYIDQSLLTGSSFVFPRINQVEFLIHSPFAKTIREDEQIERISYRQL
jgi:Uncharacterized protein conserved in bacteria